MLMSKHKTAYNWFFRAKVSGPNSNHRIKSNARYAFIYLTTLIIVFGIQLHDYSLQSQYVSLSSFCIVLKDTYITLSHNFNNYCDNGGYVAGVTIAGVLVFQSCDYAALLRLLRGMEGL